MWNLPKQARKLVGKDHEWVSEQVPMEVLNTWRDIQIITICKGRTGMQMQNACTTKKTIVVFAPKCFNIPAWNCLDNIDKPW